MGLHSVIHSSHTQLYNEDIIDLFAEQSKKLRIHEDHLSNIYVAGASEQKVNSEHEVSQDKFSPLQIQVSYGKYSFTHHCLHCVLNAYNLNLFCPISIIF